MKEIIMYTTSTCPHCKTAKEYLNSKGFHYIEKNASVDPVARNEMAAKKLMGVPSFVIGDETIVGFDRQKIEALLDYTVEACPKCGQRARVPKGKGTVRITCKQCQNTFTLKTKTM
ncbi:MAG: glutaredoxin 3 [Clostridiales bacterium]|jgi:glutaredoxin|nr:glutaredoxin 3 [Clostridiales bacterium]